jgi:FkbM family methyltransferase
MSQINNPLLEPRKETPVSLKDDLAEPGDDIFNPTVGSVLQRLVGCVGKIGLFSGMLRVYGFRTAFLRLMDYFGLLKPETYRIRLRNGLELKCEGRTRDFQMLDEVFVKRIYESVLGFVRPGDVVVDVGANIGLFSLAAALKGATVHSYEPLPRNYQILCDNVSLNRCGDKIVLHDVAISYEKGFMDLYVTEADTAGATGYPAVHPEYYENGRMRDSVRKVSVACTTLAEVLQDNIDTCDVLKVDCEGAEYAILEHASAATLRPIVRMIVEYHHYPGKNISHIAEKLRLNGFQITLMPEISLLLASRDHPKAEDKFGETRCYGRFESPLA